MEKVEKRLYHFFSIQYSSSLWEGKNIGLGNSHNSNWGPGSIGNRPVLTKLPLSTYCPATCPIEDHETWEGNTCEKIYSIKCFKLILYYKLLLQNYSIKEEKNLKYCSLSCVQGKYLGLHPQGFPCAQATLHCESLLSSWYRFNLLENNINKLLQLFMNKLLKKIVWNIVKQ